MVTTGVLVLQMEFEVFDGFQKFNLSISGSESSNLLRTVLAVFLFQHVSCGSFCSTQPARLPTISLRLRNLAAPERISCCFDGLYQCTFGETFDDDERTDDFANVISAECAILNV